MSGNIGNQQYTAGYFPWQNTSGTRYARNLDVYGGALIAPTDHYEINNAGNPVNYPSDVDRSLAISNCSNSGQDILTAWYTGTDVVYKHSNPNVMAFRQSQPAGVGTAAPVSASGLYPNPAVKELYVSAQAGSAYEVSDITGKQMLHGVLDNTAAVNVNGLASGLYLIQVRNRNGKVESFKFTKD